MAHSSLTTQTLEPEAVVSTAEHRVEPTTKDRPFDYDPADIIPNIDHIITEDDTPVDNLPSEKQQRLLTEPLYSSKESLEPKWPFLVAVNVGLFFGVYQPPIVPDVLFSLGVQVADDWWEKRHRSYFVWEFGKVPEVVIEIVSNKVGGEDSTKVERYADIGIPYYVIFDPLKTLGDEVLRVYEFDSRTRSYQPLSNHWFPLVSLGVTLWEGEFEGKRDVWLRWCDKRGRVIPTGKELAEQERRQKEVAQQQAEQERQRAEQERRQKETAQQQAEQERQRAEQERRQKETAQQRAEQLLAQLKALGVDPEA